MKSVFSYQDYRDFLRDFFAAKKSSRRGLTYKRFAEQAGFQSGNALRFVMDGTRNLSPTALHRLAVALKLTFEERQYFERLVWMNQATDPQEVHYHRMCLKEFLGHPVGDATKLANDDAVLLSQWFYPAVLVALDGCKVQSAAVEIAQLIGIEESEVEQVLNLLQKRQLVATKRGRFKLEKAYFSFHQVNMMGAVQKRYMEQQVERSLDVVRRRQDELAKFYAHTFTIERENFSIYAAKINDWLATLAAETNQDKIETVTQLNVQLFSILPPSDGA